MNRGKVYLVGAGPGDPELLTLKAVRALGQADVILIDDLVNRAVLRHTRPDARVIEVGKRASCKSTPQAFIERLMVRFARADKVVARVKGGDPFVFGRGGEEMLTLRRAGIAYEIVPGISAGMGVPASLDIPVTHRGFASGVTLVSGHLSDGAAPDWRALARTGTTLIVYMGIARLRGIAAALLAAGMDGDTPAAAIQHGTLPQEKRVVATLAQLPSAAERAGIASPALIVIGDVVRLARASAMESAMRKQA